MVNKYFFRCKDPLSGTSAGVKLKGSNEVINQKTIANVLQDYCNLPLRSLPNNRIEWEKYSLISVLPEINIKDSEFLYSKKEDAKDLTLDSSIYELNHVIIGKNISIAGQDNYVDYTVIFYLELVKKKKK